MLWLEVKNLNVEIDGQREGKEAPEVELAMCSGKTDK